MGRGVRGVYDEEEECEGEGEREGYGRAVDAKVGVVHKVDVERDVDGGYEEEHVGGRVHDAYIGKGGQPITPSGWLNTMTRTYPDIAGTF